MRNNPIRDFREKRLRWSRSKLGDRLGRSDRLIQFYEAEAGDDLLRALATIAAEEGHPDYEQLFLGLLEGAKPVSVVPNKDPDPYTPQNPEEAQLVKGLLEIVRDPDPDSLAQAGLPQMVHQLIALRREVRSKRNR